jgi:uncharacterized protein (TIGR01777 family)
VAVTGATGFIGTPLVAALQAAGHSVLALSRDPQAAAARLPGAEVLGLGGTEWQGAVASVDAVVTLAGASVVGRRWNGAYKAELRSSRIDGTAEVVAAMAGGTARVLVAGSAVGYYGDTGDREVSEESPPGDDFLARLCVDWEAAAERAAAQGVRVVRVRTGIVLGRGGGPLATLARPFRLFVGGPVGSGRQYVPWIHLEDEVALLCFALECAEARGAMNACSPNPVTGKELACALGRVLGRPAALRLPAFALRAAVGEFAEAVLSSQRILPRAALGWGFRFRFPELEPALREALG